MKSNIIKKIAAVSIFATTFASCLCLFSVFLNAGTGRNFYEGLVMTLSVFAFVVALTASICLIMFLLNWAYKVMKDEQ
jgi:hypothetical protein